MRVLLTGATGFIGQALAQALVRRGHTVVPVLRHPAAGDPQAVQADFALPPSRAWWAPHLQGIDAVVNAVGILREDAQRSFHALHTEAPSELFHACAAVGVRAVVQVSSLGADADGHTAYQRSKRAADDVLRSLPLRGAVVQPSLVYGPGGSGADMFNQMALAPMLLLPAGGGMLMQPVHVDDVVQGIVALLEDPPPQVATLAFAGPRALSMREFLAELRLALGEPAPLRALPMPAALFMAGARMAGHVPGSVLDADTASMLLAGNSTTDNALPRLLGHPPRPVREFLPARERDAQRQLSALGTWLPLLRIAVALFWLWGGLMWLGLLPGASPPPDALALFQALGWPAGQARAAALGLGLLQLALGVLCVAAPARWRRPAWLVQAVLLVAGTLMITWLLPGQWLLAGAPLAKNLPLLAVLGLLWTLERPAPRR